MRPLGLGMRSGTCLCMFPGVVGDVREFTFYIVRLPCTGPLPDTVEIRRVVNVTGQMAVESTLFPWTRPEHQGCSLAPPEWSWANCLIEYN